MSLPSNVAKRYPNAISQQCGHLWHCWKQKFPHCYCNKRPTLLSRTVLWRLSWPYIKKRHCHPLLVFLCCRVRDGGCICNDARTWCKQAEMSVLIPLVSLGDSHWGCPFKCRLKVHDITATRCLRCCYCYCWHRSYCRCKSRKVSTSEEQNSWFSAPLPCGGESQLH